MNHGDRILIDTNAIIEAHRLNCWTNLHAFFSIETVDMCARECAAGQQHRSYVPIDTNTLRQMIRVHDVTDAMRRELLCREFGAADLDDGEKDLLAFAITLPKNIFLICSPDKACMVVAAKVGLLAVSYPCRPLPNESGPEIFVSGETIPNNGIANNAPPFSSKSCKLHKFIWRCFENAGGDGGTSDFGLP